MRIGLIGWYGQENAGDERILYCIKRFFSDHDLFVTTAWQNAWENIEHLNHCDFVLIGGGGLVLRGVNYWTKLLNQLKPRIGCIGISVETEHTDAAQFVDALKTRSEFILVRDNRSAELLGNHSKVIVGPDLTFLYPYEAAPSPPKGEILGLNLCPWHYWRGELYGAGYVRMAKLNHRFPFLQKIYPFAKWDPRRLITCLRQFFSCILPIPLYTQPEVSNDSVLLKRYFPNVPDEFSPTDLASCHYLVGMRLHSLIFACQMGIPFLSLSYMSKNHQFCLSLGLPNLSLQLYNPSELPTAISQLHASSSHIRECLIEASNANKANIERIMFQIKHAIET